MHTKEQIKKRYRIVTDGRKFRVQKKVWLWWRFLGISKEVVVFQTLEEAEIVVVTMIEMEYSNQSEAWKVVEQSY